APAPARTEAPNAPAAPAPEQAAAPKPAPENPGMLARIGSYAPSPSRIVGAVSGGVSKIASYIPGL
ncbi:MAG: sodium:proton antiporter, partial [Beijerinckiaceae bacterium]|nr:sodium:proton antiporter [Beijerinckiaceae bacterium]